MGSVCLNIMIRFNDAEESLNTDTTLTHPIVTYIQCTVTIVPRARVRYEMIDSQRGA